MVLVTFKDVKSHKFRSDASLARHNSSQQRRNLLGSIGSNSFTSRQVSPSATCTAPQFVGASAASHAASLAQHDHTLWSAFRNTRLRTTLRSWIAPRRDTSSVQTLRAEWWRRASHGNAAGTSQKRCVLRDICQRNVYFCRAAVQSRGA